jgi:hypothetical protein
MAVNGALTANELNEVVEKTCSLVIALGFRCSDLSLVAAGLHTLPPAAAEARSRIARAAEALRRTACLAEDAASHLRLARASLGAGGDAENGERVGRAEAFFSGTAVPRFAEAAPRLQAALEGAKAALRARERGGGGGLLGFLGGGAPPPPPPPPPPDLVDYAAEAEAEERARHAAGEGDIKLAMDVLMGRVSEHDAQAERVALTLRAAGGAAEDGGAAGGLEAARRAQLARRRRWCSCAVCLALLAVLALLLVLQYQFFLLAGRQT